MKYTTTVAIIITICSCSIKINSKSNESSDFITDQPVVKYNNLNRVPGSNQFVEIDAKSFRSIATNNTTTLFYMLAPWCTPCVKKFVDNYPILDSLARSKQVSVVVINNSYGFVRTIEKIYKKISVQSPIYVLDNAIYNKDIDVNTADFLKEICTSCAFNSNGFIMVLSRQIEVKYFTNDFTDFAAIITKLTGRL